MTPKVALIGLGRMGSAIGANLLKHGMALTVWNRTRSKCAVLEAQGAALAATPAEAARAADVLLTSLMDDRSVLDVLQGQHGVLAGLQPGKTHACLATISPSCAEALTRLHAAAGSRYVSAPVVGRPDAAAAGQLTSLLAGDPASIPIVRSVAAAYSRLVRVLEGPAATANTVKLCLNYTIVSLIELFGEVYSFAEASGVNPAVIEEFYQQAFAHPAIKLYATRILQREFDSKDGFALRAGLKDVCLMLDAARNVGAELAIGRITLERLRAALEQGWAERDWSALTEITRARSQQ
ncbi:MAG TPA: NAD(P)-dependent oxidoreductase [Steroidobacteraceae bacterium]|nr:NAD(P)-dependent oxidoreductase [Steroidobacteraceae bacterium]